MKSELVFLIPILFYSVFSFSQNTITDSDICAELSTMLAEDQKYRGTNFNEIYPILLDSLISVEGINKADLNNLSGEQQDNLKRTAFEIAMERRKPKMSENDSLIVAQKRIDEKNTKRLIIIIKEGGWLSSDNRKCPENVKTALIFRHAPEKYWKEIRDLIEKEKSLKRLPVNEYYIIDHHLRGRPIDD